MKERDKKRSSIISVSGNVIAIIQVVVLLFLCMSGYGYLIHPSACPWLVSLSLAFGGLLLIYVALALIMLVVHPSRGWKSLLGLIVCFGPIRTYFPVNPKFVDENDSVLKVMSYNVDNFSQDDSHAHTTMMEYLKSCSADILCMQESDYYEPSYLKDSVLSRWKYVDKTMLHTNALVIGSHYPILDKCIVKGPDASHGAVIYRLLYGQETISVVNCHFVSNTISGHDKLLFKRIIKSPKKNEVKQGMPYLALKVDSAGVSRARQVDQLMPVIKMLKGAIILCGDLNDSPMSYVHGQLEKVLDDAYVSGGNGPGITYHEAGMYFRIDHIFCSKHWKVVKSYVDNDLSSSDHYPMYTWLQKK